MRDGPHRDAAGRPSESTAFSNQPPVSVISIDSSRWVGSVRRFYLSGTGSSDPEGSPLTYLWTAPLCLNTSSRYQSKFSFDVGLNGICKVSLKVTDPQGAYGVSGIAQGFDDPNDM